MLLFEGTANRGCKSKTYSEPHCHCILMRGPLWSQNGTFRKIKCGPRKLRIWSKFVRQEWPPKQVTTLSRPNYSNVDFFNVPLFLEDQSLCRIRAAERRTLRLKNRTTFQSERPKLQTLHVACGARQVAPPCRPQLPGPLTESALKQTSCKHISKEKSINCLGHKPELATLAA